MADTTDKKDMWIGDVPPSEEPKASPQPPQFNWFPNSMGNVNVYNPERVPSECESCGKEGPMGGVWNYTTDDINMCHFTVGNWSKQVSLCFGCAKDFRDNLKKLLKRTLK